MQENELLNQFFENVIKFMKNDISQANHILNLLNGSKKQINVRDTFFTPQNEFLIKEMSCK